MFCQISCNDIAGAMARYTDNLFGNHPADIFLRRMRAVTGSMSHCAGAARKARQRMFAMTAALGLPCVMFTVTPEDGINFRIRVMFKGEKGSETPPNFVLDEETLRKFISESEHIRFDHPGLCAIDFENVIGITVEHILGWDLNKNINKPGYGFFGDLDGWTYAVEEQGRKTLHAHFLLWIKGWGKLRSGLGTAKGHEEYVKQVSKYADRVMCTRLHGFSSRLVPKVCHNDCSNTVEGTEGYQKCTTQDLRKLRTKQGETSLGAKKILFCSVCKASLSSEDVTLQRLKQYYGDALAGEDENFWLSSRYLTKCRVLMEMEVLHSMLPPKCESQINMERFTPSTRLKFIVAALRNLHKSDHSPSCFKKGSECRMKLPAYPSTETLVMFDDKVTSWFDWRGNDISRSLSICVPKRAHADAYVNVHSEFASILFGCNTNVITGVDGGSVMYCTCYMSKNTEKEDNKHFADAAKHMVKNMQQQMAERKELSDLELEEEASSVGLKDCRNSMNGGRPVDMIERLTVKSVTSRYNDGYDVEEEDGDDILNEAMDQFFLSESLELGYDNEFRDSRGRFQCRSILTRCHGSHRCGKNLVVCPNVQSSERFIVVEATETRPSETNETDFSTCNRHLNVKALNELALKVVTRVVDKNGRAIDMGVNGTLENVREFAELHFCHDMEQMRSFEIIICAFIDKLYKEAENTATAIRESDCLQDYSHRESKRRRRDGIRRQIGKVINNKQLIGFLSGAGGTGKSLVIKTVSRYAQKLCEALHVKFDKRSIVVTARTGAAAVSINGETTAKAFAFKREVRNELEEFKHAYLVIVDEISFASVEDVDVLNQKMKQILDNTMAPFGGVPVVFSGDFTQLLPVGGIPLYRRDEGAEWRQSINVFMELKTNHRFGSIGKNIPPDAVYATKTNVDRMAINDAIFVKHLEKTHFTDPNRQPPMHTLCIKAGNPRFHLTGTRKEYRVMENKAQDVMYAAVGEAHVSDRCKKYHDPLLKLYLGRPLCINQNEDVSSCIANGAMCEFRGLKLKPGASMDQLETIVIDGYYVNCVSVTQVESLLLKMLDGNAGEEGEHIIELNPKTIYASARFPEPCLGPITKKSMRTSRRISFDQFPINCANARTVHKLQGRSIKKSGGKRMGLYWQLDLCLSVPMHNSTRAIFACTIKPEQNQRHVRGG
ncbi:PIF1-like helicase [Nitzschia inconspicua]|uniref:ATP-dependent DNA helicase n=1 Tax=Nitzschia inconspicua TaxID=303405 RepID=A0A9K3LRZ0_9STRA|nr:PIF1-like helicase [Nitzschia inconspicua]